MKVIKDKAELKQYLAGILYGEADQADIDIQVDKTVFDELRPELEEGLSAPVKPNKTHFTLNVGDSNGTS